MADAVRQGETKARVAGAGAALVVVAPFGAALVAQPAAAVVALLGAGFVGVAGVYLSIQQREAVGTGSKRRHRDLDRHRFQAGSHGGLFGAWVAAADGDERARRRHIAGAVVSFLWALCLGSFATLVLVSVLVRP